MRKLFCIFFIVLLFTACEKSDGGQTTELPATLRITAELSEDSPAEVTLYSADYIIPDEETIVREFLSDDADEINDLASGPQWIVYAEEGPDEVLFVYSDGMQYIRVDPYYNLIQNCLLVSKTPSQTQQKHRMLDDMKRCDPGKDLSFASRQEVERIIEQKLDACGFSGFALREILPMDAETLNWNRQIYLEAEEVIGIQDPEIEETGIKEKEFTQEDEEYFLTYRQVIDGIPVANDYLTKTGMYFRYSAREGMKNFEVTHYLVCGEALYQAGIIEPQEALNRYVENYRKAIHFDQTDIYEIELNYVTVKDSEGSYIRPAWMLRMDITLNGTDKEWVVNPETGKQEQTEKTLNLNEVTGELMHEYQTVAIDAVSGGILNETEVPR